MKLLGNPDSPTATDDDPARAALLDSAALGTSVLCLVHCLALPLLVAFLPGVGALIEQGELLHILLLALAIPISGFALISGSRGIRSKLPLAIGIAGLGSMTIGVLSPVADFETVATVIGGLALVCAHVMNWRLRSARFVA